MSQSVDRLSLMFDDCILRIHRRLKPHILELSHEVSGWVTKDLLALAGSSDHVDGREQGCVTCFRHIAEQIYAITTKDDGGKRSDK